MPSRREREEALIADARFLAGHNGGERLMPDGPSNREQLADALESAHAREDAIRKVMEVSDDATSTHLVLAILDGDEVKG